MSREDFTGGSQRDDRPAFEMVIVACDYRLRCLLNVHAILSVSALVVMVLLIYSELIIHGEAKPLTIAEITHFAGWAYLELPDAFMLEVIEEEIEEVRDEDETDGANRDDRANRNERDRA